MLLLDKIKRNRENLYTIIFEADTQSGKVFNIILIYSILASVLIVIFESITVANTKYRTLFALGEWFFTILFTIEYILRIYVVKRKAVYIFSFYGIVDLLSILPTFLSLFLPGIQYLLDIRILRLARIFRIFKLSRFISEGQVLRRALIASMHKIIVFFSTLALLVVVIGSLMYVIEGPENGYKNIPTGIYWAIVTLTTVGYGDISPQTAAGQFIASFVMIIGYSIIAVPTGIFTAEFARKKHAYQITTQVCPNCLSEGHDKDAIHCKYCGEELNPEPQAIAQKKGS